MSRIHEALKKAAQERNDQASARPVADFLDLSTPVVTPPVDGHRPEPQTGLPPATDTRYLRFEEFAKRCRAHGGKGDFVGSCFVRPDSVQPRAAPEQERMEFAAWVDHT